MAAPWRAAWELVMLVAAVAEAVVTAKESAGVGGVAVVARRAAVPRPPPQPYPTDEAAWMDLMPPPPAAAGKQREVLDWAMLYRSLKGRRRRHELDGLRDGAMLEPFDMPGMVVTDKLTVSAEKSSGALLDVAPGLHGSPGSVSLELRARPGCFLVGGGLMVQVGCGGVRKRGGDGGAGFPRAASFARAEPLRRHHPMSFAARGVRRSFILEPLFTSRDEYYTIYFNLVA
ncbi:hypothetical protein C2845_PM09G18550 [Panicum miliaceum]|uniref:Uncharacterized protein n=1 Tax=Panicum miliaceum TaxID=4540 RepID=A0A3L6RZH7_PANMI|nr:hypothetical protein C2845_PM09G18550 [Panicum miliaceum]